MEMFPTYEYWQRPCETLVDSLLLSFSLFFLHIPKCSVERVNADYSTPKTQWQAPRDPASRSGHSSDGPYEGRAVFSYKVPLVQNIQ